MDYQDLLGLSTEHNDVEAKRLFLELVEADNLWQSAFTGQSKKEAVYGAFKKDILDYTFALFRKKVKAKHVPENTNFKRLFTKLIREAVGAHKQDVEKPQSLLTFLIELGCIKDYQENEFHNYIEGINPFKNKMDEREVSTISRWYKMLPPDCRKLLEYKYALGLSHLQIAQRENTEVGDEESSRTRTNHCMSELRKKCYPES